MKRTVKNCVISLLLCAVMLISQMETAGFAAPVTADPPANPTEQPSVAGVTITAFEALDEGVLEQPVPAGTQLAELALPDTLAATGFAAAEQDAAPLTIAGVTWELNPEHEINAGNDSYDPASGSYVFTPVLPEGYTAASGVSLPEIRVMVRAENMAMQPRENHYLQSQNSPFTFGDFRVELIGDSCYADWDGTLLTLTPTSTSATYPRVTISTPNNGPNNPTSHKLKFKERTFSTTNPVKLNGVHIDADGDAIVAECPTQDIGSYTFGLELVAGSSNTLRGSNHAFYTKRKVKITGPGSLVATSAGNGSAGIEIDSTNYRMPENIYLTIASGNITAQGGQGGSGIRASNVIINGGSITGFG